LHEEKRIDILVHNSGGPAPNLPLQTSPAEVHTALEAHLYAAMQLSQVVSPKMIANKYGRIIHVVSVTARAPIVNPTAMIMVMLVIYSFKDLPQLEGATAISQLACGALTAICHIRYGNVLLSIFCGVGLYVILNQYMFS